MAENIGALIIAAALLYLIYLGLNALSKAMLDEGDTLAFILSLSGRVLMGFISFVVFCVLTVFILINFSGIQC